MTVSLLPESVMSSVTSEENSLRLCFADVIEPVALNLQWLRDQCPCDICRFSQTDERRLLPWKSERPRVSSASVVDGVLDVVWADGHMSPYDSEWAAYVNRSISRSRRNVNLWRAGHQISRFDHDRVLNDSEELRRMFEAFAADGAVVVTGSPTEPGSIIDFMKSIGVTLLDSSLGFIFDVKLDPLGYNAAFTSEELPLHNDNAQYAYPPSGQALAMVVNEASGGETIVVDGWSVLEQLQQRNPAAVDVLCDVIVGFRQYSEGADGFYRSPVVVRDSAGSFVHIRFSNALMQPLEFDHPQLDAWYDAYRELGALIHDPSNRVEFRLNAGDSLLVNGYRMLHARTAFAPDGPRHLQDVYFTAQDIFDRLSVLNGEAVNAMVHG